jgi:hypothetical protein
MKVTEEVARRTPDEKNSRNKHVRYGRRIGKSKRGRED